MAATTAAAMQVCSGRLAASCHLTASVAAGSLQSLRCVSASQQLAAPMRTLDIDGCRDLLCMLMTTISYGTLQQC